MKKLLRKPLAIAMCIAIVCAASLSASAALLTHITHYGFSTSDGTLEFMSSLQCNVNSSGTSITSSYATIRFDEIADVTPTSTSMEVYIEINAYSPYVSDRTYGLSIISINEYYAISDSYSETDIIQIDRVEASYDAVDADIGTPYYNGSLTAYAYEG
ncbi:MAG: hypothetical protein E7665_05020 [Ruminococcaceae bacterium]|nr:hypothetical protein [Oscillospiraceae bacterium]